VTKKYTSADDCYTERMGRGQQTTVPSDQFSTIFGVRRGSQAAQMLRDREEICSHIRERLVPDMRLTPENLEEFYEHFVSDDPLVQETLRDALLFNMHSDGLEAVSQTLSWPTVKGLLPEVEDLLRELVTERVRIISSEDTSQVDLSEINCLNNHTFSFLQSPFPLEAAQRNQKLIQATANYYMGETLPLGNVINVLRSVVSQPDSHLSLYQPLLAVVEAHVKEEESEDSLDAVTHTLNSAEKRPSHERRAFFSHLRATLERMKTLTPLELAVLTHPVWDEKEFVTKEDILSNGGQGLPGGPRAAQRILRLLNGGTSGKGIQYTIWCPQAITGKRFAYSLSGLGQKVRAEQAGY